MKRALRAPITLTILLLLSPPAWADDDVAFEDLPRVVQQAAEREIGDGIVTEIEIDEEPFGLIYEIEFERDSMKYEVDITERGRVIRTKTD